MVKDVSRKWELKVFKSTIGIWHPAPEGRLLSKYVEGENLQEGAVIDPNAWDHEHCELCFETISDHGNSQKKGYTDGKAWVCEKCYDTYILLYRKENS